MKTKETTLHIEIAKLKSNDWDVLATGLTTQLHALSLDVEVKIEEKDLDGKEFLEFNMSLLPKGTAQAREEELENVFNSFNQILSSPEDKNKNKEEKREEAN